MFIAQGLKKGNDFWKYLVGSVFVILASFIGQIPITIAALMKTLLAGKPLPTNEEDLYALFDSNALLFLMLISFVFAIFGLYFVVRKFHNQDFKEIITSRKKIDWKRFFVAFSIWAIISISLILLSYFSGDSEIVLQFNLIPFLILSAIALLLIPIQTSTEELVFRGYLMQGFYNLSKNKWFPLVMTSVIFGGMHWFNPEVAEMGPIIMVYYIGTGLFFGIITLMDEGTELALGFHASNNLISALLITADYSVLRTNAIFKDLSKPEVNYEIFMPILFYIILLIIFTKIYKWTNWKEKLTGNHIEKFNEPTI
ncbi:type II CAAX endopeptidase family protein [uncultured Flavobacterium sp.]|uniref:CPBP family intramembrane glutamic endopeptidase n=1 Tax=uncultured Flavobacterium sp. TaxID=165435 RepID=UPI0030EB2A00|tara:strand:+ start:24055 stop:24990 length:936 start_codon:yes stop_codon:yes gene_type:complete